MSKEIQRRLDKLEEHVSEELEAIRNIIENKEKETEKSKRDLFTIKTYKEVCKELKESEETCPYKQIKQIERLFNGDWEKDWNNTNQAKWYPYFNLKASGGEVGFSRSGYHRYSSDGQVAFYKDQKTSDYVGRTFWSIYKQLI